RGPGAEGGHRPARSSGYGHNGAAAEKVDRQDAGYDDQDEEHREHQADARYAQVDHDDINPATSGRKEYCEE
ncbi:hypothetical protein ACRV5K_004365, partial [Enterobacter hormaechei]